MKRLVLFSFIAVLSAVVLFSCTTVKNEGASSEEIPSLVSDGKEGSPAVPTSPNEEIEDSSPSEEAPIEEEESGLEPYEREDFFPSVFNSVLGGFSLDSAKEEGEDQDRIESAESQDVALEVAELNGDASSSYESFYDGGSGDVLESYERESGTNISNVVDEESSLSDSSEEAIDIDPPMTLTMFRVLGMGILIIILFASAFVIRVINKEPLPLWFSIVLPMLFAALSIVMSAIVSDWTNWYLVYIVLLFTFFIFRIRGKSS